MKLLRYAWIVAIAGCSQAPNGVSTGPTTFTVEKLKDPETCKGCHPHQYEEWSGSMHAYATDDPLFLALNKKGQDAQVGSFCVKCHAPMAVHDGINDGPIDAATLAKPLHGITCYYCHNVDNVLDTHDNPLHIAEDVVMRGEYGDPVSNKAHRSDYSKYIDRDATEAASMCGACHDIVNKHGTHIERTYAEWLGSVYATAAVKGTTCSQCHMPQTKDLVPIAEGNDVSGVFSRRRHSHQFPAVDRAVTDWPEAAAQQTAVQDFIDTELQSTLCVRGYPNMPGANLMVVVDNVASGHQWPSGAAQDRRLWFEVIAYKSDAVIYKSGVVLDGSAPTSVMPTDDPDLWLIRDCMFDTAGKETHNFWDAASTESNLLPAQLTFDPSSPDFYKSHIYQNYPRAADKKLDMYPDRVTLRALVQPFPLDLFDELYADPASQGFTAEQVAAMRAKLATPIVVGKPVEWTLASTADPVHGESYLDSLHTPVNCVMPTNLRASADKVLAKNHSMCSP